MNTPFATSALGVYLGGLAALGLAVTSPRAIACADEASQGTTYHADVARTGNFVVPGLDWRRAATLHRLTGFAGRTTGNVNTQPLYWRAPGAAHGMVIVATDQNVVEAFQPDTGASLWRTTLGPVDTQTVPNCGTPRQQGVYGTPVIDPASGTFYAIGSLKDPQGTIQFGVFALSLADGSMRPGWPVLLATAVDGQSGLRFVTLIHDQHTALTLVGGRIYAGFAANVGDCGTYHGWVVGVDTATAQVVASWRARAVRAGVWSAGGVVSDGTSLFATTGNGIEPNHWLDGETVFRFAPSLARTKSSVDYFVPSDFKALDNNDYDLGGSSPLPLDLPKTGGGVAHWLLQIGKGGVADILDRGNLGGLGGELAAVPVAKPPIQVTGTAFPTAHGVRFAFPATGTACPHATTPSGLVAIDVAATPAPSVTTGWCVAQGSLGIPMTTTTDGQSEPIVWDTTAARSAFLLGYRGDTGALVASTAAESDCLALVPRHATILAAEGQLYVGAQGKVCAFGFGPG